jgi:thiol-disulfide isomerase/thioredoxin
MRKILFPLLAALLLISTHAVSGEFLFKDMAGKEQRLSDYKGKWVLVNFWATWCPPCLDEMPDLVDMHNARKDRDFVVIGVAMSSGRDAVISLVEQLDVSYPIVMGDNQMAAQVGKVPALPTSYLYDPTGKLVSYQTGAITREAIENYIRSKTKQVQ